MKKRDLINRLKAKGWWLLREGADHHIYTDGEHIQPVPRSPETKEGTAKKIIKRWGL